MTTPNDGGPAFPSGDLGMHGTFGMTLRDYYAGHALAGMAANPEWDNSNWEDVARQAHKAADAMLAERAKRTERGE